MKLFSNRSFRGKLLLCFLLTGVVPLLICAALMLSIFQAVLNRNAREAALSDLNGTAETLETLFQSCSLTMLRLRGEETVVSALGTARDDTAQSAYSALYSLPAELRGQANVSLYSRAGRRLYTTASPGGQTELSPNWGVLRAARLQSGVVFVGASGGECIQAACAVRSGSAVLGYVVMAISESQMTQFLESWHSAEGGILLLDPYWRELCRSRAVRGEDLALRLREKLLAGQTLSDGGSYNYYVRQCPVTGFFLVAQQPAPVAGWVMRLLRLVSGLAIALCLGLCTAVSMGLSRQLFAPIRALNQAMGEVEAGRLETRLDISGADEMAQLSGRFNRMAQRLSAYLQESIHRQRELNDAQIRMMQAQLNPHFLYNTLDTIKWMGKINHMPEVATISADLADILRRSISWEEFVPLSDELSLLDRYVEIQTIRFPGKFQLNTRIEPDTLGISVPRLMLQPLVENAILHGFENSEGGVVIISAVRVGNELSVTVRDNGCGMSEESIRRFERQTSAAEGHLGLFNVNAILRLHYGPEYGLVFVPVQGSGTCIRITLPFTGEGEARLC